MIKLTLGSNSVGFSGDQSTLVKLRKALSFKHPSAHFIMKTMKRGWDGMINPMNSRGVIGAGLLEKSLKLLSDIYDGDIEIDDLRILPNIGVIPTHIGEFELYYYQVEAITQIVYNSVYGINWPRGFISAGMGAGKTLMMFGVHIAYDYARTMILLDNSKLYIQIKDDLQKIFPDSYGYMQGKNVKWGQIMVCMAKTVSNRLKEYEQEFNTFQILLTDEADLAGNKTYGDIYGRFHRASVRIGFSGTIFLRDLAKDRLRNNTLRTSFGEVIMNITSKELEQQGFTTKAVIKIHKGVNILNKYETFNEEFQEGIAYNKKKDEQVLSRVLFNIRTKKFPLMVFTRFIDQTEMLGKFLQDNIPTHRIEFVHHKITDQTIIDDFREGKISVLVCSLFLKRGLSFPKVRCILNVSAGEFYSNPLQILGRGTRKSEGKDVFYYEDFEDNGHYLSRHFKQRLNHYKRQGHEIRDLR